MNKWFACLLAGVLMINLLAVSAFAEETEETEVYTEETAMPTESTELPSVTQAPERGPNACGEALAWSFGDGILTVEGSGPMDDFNGDAPWKDYKSQIETVRLMGSVTSVGSFAFSDYDALKNLELGPALTEIGTGAFSGCDGLKEVSLPRTFRVFGEEAFSHCSGLKEIHFEGGMPKFKLNCLWNTYADLIYPAENPWPLQHIQQLEEAFQGRIEFLASDGTDPYVPQPEESTEDGEETTAATVPTAAPTEEKIPETTAAAVPVPETTEALPAEIPAETTPQTEETVSQTTEEYVVLPEPEKEKPAEGMGLKGKALVALMILSGGGALLLIGYMAHNSKKDFTGDFSEILLEDEKKKPGKTPAAGKKKPAAARKKGKYSK